MTQTTRVLLEERVTYRCLLIATCVTRHLAPKWSADFGLSVTNWRVMAVIGRFEPVSAKEVAARTSTDAFFVTRAIDNLVEQGYVDRGIDSEDRRRLSLTLTRKVKTVHCRVEDMINEVETRLLAGLSTAEKQVFLHGLFTLATRAMQLDQPKK
mgnify:FL=1